MRQVCLIGVLITCFGWAITEARGQSSISTNQPAKLQLTTEVIDARFCEHDHLRLGLRLRYYNNGSQSLILYRQSNTIMTYFISRTFAEAHAEKYEQKYSPMQSSVGPPDLVESDRPDPERFVILKPSSSYDITTQADLLFIGDDNSKDPTLLRPGRHILQIRVRTWSEQQHMTMKLRERWSAYGHLWTPSIVSLPMMFIIAEHPQVVACSTKVDHK
jgi:hypothetical protein